MKARRMSTGLPILNEFIQGGILPKSLVTIGVDSPENEVQSSLAGEGLDTMVATLVGAAKRSKRKVASLRSPGLDLDISHIETLALNAHAEGTGVDVLVVNAPPTAGNYYDLVADYERLARLAKKTNAIVIAVLDPSVFPPEPDIADVVAADKKRHYNAAAQASDYVFYVSPPREPAGEWDLGIVSPGGGAGGGIAFARNEKTGRFVNLPDEPEPAPVPGPAAGP